MSDLKPHSGHECPCPNCPSPTDCEGQRTVEQLEAVTQNRDGLKETIDFLWQYPEVRKLWPSVSIPASSPDDEAWMTARAEAWTSNQDASVVREALEQEC